MKKAIVFGGSGFIGSAVVKALAAHGIDVCAVVKPGFSDSPEKFRLDGLSISIIECDLRNVLQLPELLPWKTADVFYQFAWEGTAGNAMMDYSIQIQNISWLLDSIVAAAKLGCKRFVGAGTISQDELRFPEGRLYQKDRHRIFRCAAQTCEYMGQSVAYEQGIEFIWPIISNVYGEGELVPRLITALIQKLLRGEPMQLSSGTQNYDFIYLSDAGEAFYLIGKVGKANRRYNIASGNVRPLKDHIKQVGAIVAPHVELGFGKMLTNGLSLEKDSFDTTILREDTGFRAKVSFEQGITKTADWWNRQMWHE